MRPVMAEETPLRKSVDEFIAREMDTVPHLEALLLLWNSRPKEWTVEEMAGSLYVSAGEALVVLHGLARRRLATMTRPEVFSYPSDEGRNDALVAAVEAAYRRDLIRISRMIHAKGSPGLRDFADAFRFTKEKEGE